MKADVNDNLMLADTPGDTASANKDNCNDAAGRGKRRRGGADGGDAASQRAKKRRAEIIVQRLLRRRTELSEDGPAMLTTASDSSKLVPQASPLTYTASSSSESTLTSSTLLSTAETQCIATTSALVAQTTLSSVTFPDTKSSSALSVSATASISALPSVTGSSPISTLSLSTAPLMSTLSSSTQLSHVCSSTKLFSGLRSPNQPTAISSLVSTSKLTIPSPTINYPSAHPNIVLRTTSDCPKELPKVRDDSVATLPLLPTAMSSRDPLPAAAAASLLQQLYLSHQLSVQLYLSRLQQVAAAATPPPCPPAHCGGCHRRHPGGSPHASQGQTYGGERPRAHARPHHQRGVHVAPPRRALLLARAEALQALHLARRLHLHPGAVAAPRLGLQRRAVAAQLRALCGHVWGGDRYGGKAAPHLRHSRSRSRSLRKGT